MRKIPFLLALPALALFLFVMTGCNDAGQDSTPATSTEETAKTASSSGHAPAGYVSGSHDDWCSGHDVPESLCTRCNASLIPAFKATGDWCAPHQLPESQCLKCNPDLKIERPSKPTVSADGDE
jgi:hypothetical protein